MMSEKHALAFRLLDTSFDSTSSRDEDHYDIPSHSVYRWRRRDQQKKLIWSNRRPRFRQARLVIPSLGALVFLFWLYASDNRIEDFSTLTKHASSNFHKMKKAAHLYQKIDHSYPQDIDDAIEEHKASSALRHSTAHDALPHDIPIHDLESAAIVHDVLDRVDIEMQSQEEALLDTHHIHRPHRHIHPIHHPSKSKDIEEVKEIINLVKQVNPLVTATASASLAATIPIQTSTPTIAATNTTPPLPSKKAYLPSYEEYLAGPTSVWTYQDDFIADHASCAAMRLKLQPKNPSTEMKQPMHDKSSIGQSDLFGGSTCSTYQQRFEPYTDQSLGLTYRKSNDVITSDWLLGPKKPKLMRKDQWTFYLQHRNRGMNNKVTREMQKDIPDWKALSNRCGLDSSIKMPMPKHRTVILHRFFEGFVMTEDKILDMRAMLTEMVINRPDQGWDIRILVELKETPGAFVSKSLQRAVLSSMMPFEFWGLVEFWSEDREKSIMPGLSGPLDYGFDISCLLPSQLYSFYHPEYDFIYNWEADIRFLGNYDLFFDRVEEYGRNESMNIGMQKYSRWYIPDSKISQRHWNRYSKEKDGIGKEPDLLTFNAILDVKGSDWFHSSIHALGEWTPYIRLKISTFILT